MNIAGLTPIDDPEYRYKMPRLVGKIEGRGNGIKTVVVNCSDIALSLHRNPAEVTKFFGCELGAQSKYDQETDRSVVNGAFDTNAMQAHLSKYIENFVLCPSCRLPETKYKFKNQCIFHKCLACGAEELVDMNHKLTTFILKERAAEKRNKSKGDKDDKKKKRKEKKAALADDDKKDKEKKDKKKKKDKEKKKKSKESVPAVEEIEWHTDLSEEAVQARMAEAQAIEDAARSAMTGQDDDEVVATLDNLEIDDKGAIETATNAVKTFLETSSDPTALVDEVERQQTYAALPQSHRVAILFRAAFDGSILKNNQIAKFGPALEKVVKTLDSQYRLIGLCEELCGMSHPELSASFPVILKLLYDDDILDEEAILTYTSDSSIRQSHAPDLPSEKAALLMNALTPFLEWLKNAEEESEDESD